MGLGSEVWGLGFGVEISEIRVESSGFGVHASGFRVLDLPHDARVLAVSRDQPKHRAPGPSR